jgi:ribonucleoside-diphosphate reductase alpha chain
MKEVNIYELAAQTAAAMMTKHPDYSYFAARIVINVLYAKTVDSFSETVRRLYTANGGPKVSEKLYRFAMSNSKVLDAEINHALDDRYTYFGYMTLAHVYLLRVDGEIVERPQHLLMRVAAGIHDGDVSATIETYRLMSRGFFTHASPTMFNVGTPREQASSCFLLSSPKVSIDEVFDKVKQCAKISDRAGGIGFGAHYTSNAVPSHGLIDMLRVFNSAARYASQDGKRPGAFAVYLEPWHVGIFDFLRAKRNTGAEESKARDLFFALWTPDLFMKRVEENREWSLFDPAVATGLSEVWGDAFEVCELSIRFFFFIFFFVITSDLTIHNLHRICI